MLHSLYVIYEYPYKPYVTKNSDPLATFLPLIAWVFIQLFVVGSERRVTERMIAVQGQFRVIQGRNGLLHPLAVWEEYTVRVVRQTFEQYLNTG